MINSPLENDVLLVTEYMAGGAIMDYSKELKIYVFSSSAARILKGRGYLPPGEDATQKNEKTLAEEKKDDSDLEGERRMTDAEAVSLSLDLLRGVHYLHSKGVCHRSDQNI